MILDSDTSVLCSSLLDSYINCIIWFDSIQTWWRLLYIMSKFIIQQILLLIFITSRLLIWFGIVILSALSAHYYLPIICSTYRKCKFDWSLTFNNVTRIYISIPFCLLHGKFVLVNLMKSRWTYINRLIFVQYYILTAITMLKGVLSKS